MLLQTRLLLLLSATLAAGQNALVDFLNTQPDLSTLTTALSSVPDLVTALLDLASTTNITILAPVNTAFAAVSNTSAAGLALSTRDSNATTALLSYHVLDGHYPASAFTNVSTYYSTLFTQDSVTAGSIRTNVTTGQSVGLVRNGANYTIISGNLATSNVVEANLTLGNVTLHKISSVLTVPRNLSSTALALNATAAAGALTQAGLVSTLDTVDDLTIFVPSNAAFQAAGSAFLNASNETLIDVLGYHAILGSVVFAQNISNTTVEAYSGGELTLSVVNGSVFVNTARVIVPNILLSNGVAHVIDAVLNPSSTTVNRTSLNPTASATPAFSGASSVSNVPFTSGIAAPTTTLTTPTIATTASVVATTTTGSIGAAAPTAVAGGAVWLGLAAAGALGLVV